MRGINVVLIMGVLIFGGCTGTFQPKNSTCNRIEHDLEMMKLSGNRTKYSPSDLSSLENIIDDCHTANSLSKADYKKYKELLNNITELKRDADHILNTSIHDERIK